MSSFASTNFGILGGGWDTKSYVRIICVAPSPGHYHWSGSTGEFGPGIIWGHSCVTARYRLWSFPCIAKERPMKRRGWHFASKSSLGFNRSRTHHGKPMPVDTIQLPLVLPNPHQIADAGAFCLACGYRARVNHAVDLPLTPVIPADPLRNNHSLGVGIGIHAQVRAIHLERKNNLL